jgi:transposase InsO family protein
VPGIGGFQEQLLFMGKESFFHTLKTELIYFEKYRNRREAQGSVFEYIEVFYNRVRRHSALNYCSPVEFEKRACDA